METLRTEINLELDFASPADLRDSVEKAFAQIAQSYFTGHNQGSTSRYGWTLKSQILKGVARCAET